MCWLVWTRDAVVVGPRALARVGGAKDMGAADISPNMDDITMTTGTTGGWGEDGRTDGAVVVRPRRDAETFLDSELLERERRVRDKKKTV